VALERERAPSSFSEIRDGLSREAGSYRCFILNLDRDPHARVAMEAYANSIRETFPQTYIDILNWLDLGTCGEVG
jgi:hypothetical protein